MTLTTERANPLRQWNPDWGGCSTARRPVAAVNKLFLRRPVFVKRFTHEMTLREVPGSKARTTRSAVAHRTSIASPARMRDPFPGGAGGGQHEDHDGPVGLGDHRAEHVTVDAGQVAVQDDDLVVKRV